MVHERKKTTVTRLISFRERAQLGETKKVVTFARARAQVLRCELCVRAHARVWVHVPVASPVAKGAETGRNNPKKCVADGVDEPLWESRSRLSPRSLAFFFYSICAYSPRFASSHELEVLAGCRLFGNPRALMRTLKNVY